MVMMDAGRSAVTAVHRSADAVVRTTADHAVLAAPALFVTAPPIRTLLLSQSRSPVPMLLHQVERMFYTATERSTGK